VQLLLSFRRRSGKSLQGGLHIILVIPVPWLEPEDVSPLDSVAPPSSSPASSLPDSSELEEPLLEELPWPVAADVPGRA
jgi:hypothetical protein